MTRLLQGLLALGIVGLDRAVKSWAAAHLAGQGAQPFLPGVQLIYTENRGAAFGMLAGMRWLFVGITVLAIALIAWALVRRWARYPLGSWALALIAGGALGNLVDRAFVGHVVDMFEFTFVDFAIFNVADIFVTVGGVLFCAYLLFCHEEKGESAKREAGRE